MWTVLIKEIKCRDYYWGLTTHIRKNIWPCVVNWLRFNLFDLENCKVSRGISYKIIIKRCWFLTLKRKCQFWRIFVTRCTDSYHFNNVQCSQWRKFHQWRQNVDIFVSVSQLCVTWSVHGTGYCSRNATVSVFSSVTYIDAISLTLVF